MNPVEMIARKRDGGVWSEEEIRWFIERYVQDEVPDYQVAAWAMAVYFQGLSNEELTALTLAMTHSGQVLEWPQEFHPLVDKHSTGGVGDKVSLLLAPWLACCGVRVPMISGRALGPTGGTLDKLEGIPGVRTELSLEQFRRVVSEVGCAIVGATHELVPADKKLYALRDVTATIPSIPLITASILSKKLAEGIDALVLDVKYGRGAFMKTLEQAQQLADSLSKTGMQLGLPTAALLHAMDIPLGRRVGNALEVQEVMDVLQGQSVPDLLEVTRRLAVAALQLVGFDDEEKITRQLNDVLASGAVWERFCAMVRAQGGNPLAPLPRVDPTPWCAPRSGTLATIDAEQIGYALVEMGGGRMRQGEPIDPRVGFEFLVPVGQTVRANQELILVYAADENGFQKATLRLERAILIQ